MEDSLGVKFFSRNKRTNIYKMNVNKVYIRGEHVPEGQRFFDLVRWKIAIIEINTHNLKEKNSELISMA